jgi:hypothetical protein
MNTNINTDNYEAYLLDYMEGNLSPDEAKQLKAFVAAQGLDWDELTEDLPHLEAPAIAHPDKESLKKKRTLVPLYVKIASAAAAAGLLLTVTLWPEKQLPKAEPIVDLKPIEAKTIEMPLDLTVLPQRPNISLKSQAVAEKKNTIPQRDEVTLLASLPPISASVIQIDQPMDDFDEPDFDKIAYNISTSLTSGQSTEPVFESEFEEERNLFKRGLLWMTNGRHDTFASLIGSGVRQAKQDFTEAATDLALTAYYRAEEHIDMAKENWEEKRGK